ncbi:MAG: N-glycosylase/DNA lyase [Thermoplasmata archaeon]
MESEELTIQELKEIYKKIEPIIRERTREFQKIWDSGEDSRLFEELVFCLFTPQSKAQVCWETVLELKEEDALMDAEREELAEKIKRVRFRNNKAGYLVEARDKFMDPNGCTLRDRLDDLNDQKEARRWLVKNVKGLGYKEASHFLRNIGKGDDLAILDRHILKNLKRLGVIDDIPKSLAVKRYLAIEERMSDFSEEVGIPLGHLDLVLWYMETGEVFK